MIVFLKLTTAGVDSGPFDLYSNLDAYSEPFEENVSKASLIAGYSTDVPDYATTVRITSKENCISSVDITLRDVECDLEGYTGEITTSTSSTTSTTTTAPPEAGITLSLSMDSAAQACAFYGDPGSEVYYYADDIWYIATGLYQDINETLFAPGGFWYCNGVYARLWGGTEFVGLPVEC